MKKNIVKKVTKDVLKEIKSLKKQKVSVKDIAKKLKLGRSTVYNYLSK